MYIFLLLAVLAVAVPTKKVPIDVGSVLSATSIFYSILLGFFVAASMTNLSRLKTLVAIETGALIAMYNIVALSLPQKLDEMRAAIDCYLIKRFDYEVHQYVEPTTKEFFSIFDVLKGAQTKSEGEAAALDYIAEGMYYVPQARREITIVGAKIVTGMSWILLNVLSLLIVFLLFLLRDGSLESALVTALLSTSAFLALLILNDIDSNRFGEAQFSINTYEDVFSAIGKPRYYPTSYIKTGRHKPRVGEYRTGTSSHHYLVRKKRFSKAKPVDIANVPMIDPS